MMGIFRAFLALSVFSWHMAGDDEHFLFNGAYAVLSFYMISGFLMSLTFSQNYRQQEQGTSRFFFNRFLRIYPPYLAVVMLTVIFHRASGESDPFVGYGDASPDNALFVRLSLVLPNIFIFGMDVLTFLNNSDMLSLPTNARLFGPSWSIACELIFYLGVPIIMTRSNRFLCCLILISVLLRYWLGHNYHWRYDIDPWRYYIAPSTWIFFLMGMLSFRVCIPICKVFSSRAALVSGFGIFTVIFGVSGVDRYGSLDSALAWSYYISLFVVLPLLWDTSRANPLDNWIGQLSYPIYVLHPLIIAGYEYGFRGSQPELGRYVIVTFSLLAASVTLHYVVERPVEIVRTVIRKKWQSSLG